MQELKIGNRAFNGNIDCFENLLEISNCMPVDHDLIINLSNLREVNPFNMLLLALSIRQQRTYFDKITFKVPSEKIDGYMHYMGFYETCGAPSRGICKGSHRLGKYICIKEINISPSGSIGVDYEAMETEAEKLADMFQFDKKLRLYITYCFFEMIRNVYEHSGTYSVYVCAQYWPSHCLMEIAIADEGCGIKKAMEKRFMGFSERKLMEYAMAPGISALSNHQFLEKDDYYENSGYGLFMTKELALSYGGSFILCSGNYGVRYHYNDHMVQQDFYNTKFEGTGIAIRFCTESFNDFDVIRKNIVAKAERESKNYKGAIHKASRSSGGAK